MNLKCLLGCSNLVYITARLKSHGREKGQEVCVYECRDCGKTHEKIGETR